MIFQHGLSNYTMFGFAAVGTISLFVRILIARSSQQSWPLPCDVQNGNRSVVFVDEAKAPLCGVIASVEFGTR
jgi:hypothetical protein